MLLAERYLLNRVISDNKGGLPMRFAPTHSRYSIAILIGIILFSGAIVPLGHSTVSAARTIQSSGSIIQPSKRLYTEGMWIKELT